MKKYVFIYLVLLCPIFLDGSYYTLVVSFDGFRYDYTDAVDTPAFDRIRVLGAKAHSLIPVFPSLTFPNHYSIATGSYSSSHNIIANQFYDKELEKSYSMYDPESVTDGRFYKSEPIWVTAEKQGIRTATFFWIGSEAKIKGYRPSKYLNYDPSIPSKARVDSVFNWFELDLSIRPRLVMLYFNEPDYTGHVHGPNDFRTRSMVSKTDSLLGYILDMASTSIVYDSLNIIVLSDHGMTDVGASKTILLDEYLDLSTVNYNGGGALALINTTDRQSTQSIVSILERINNVSLFLRDNIPPRFHFLNKSTPDITILANEGYFITSRDQMKNKKRKPVGMHGYDSILQSMHGIFYAFGPEIKKNIIIDSFENIHIYPLLCNLLDLEPYIPSSNRHDWDNRLLETIKK